MKPPTAEASEEAKIALRALAAVPHRKASRTVRVQAGGKGPAVPVTVPREAFELFLEIIGQMANGNAVAIVPVHAELTTQQAADLLNVSRPFLVSLLDGGGLPYSRVGTHRRVRVADLVEYKQREDAPREVVEGELTAEATENALYY